MTCDYESGDATRARGPADRTSRKRLAKDCLRSVVRCAPNALRTETPLPGALCAARHVVALGKRVCRHSPACERGTVD